MRKKVEIWEESGLKTDQIEKVPLVYARGTFL